MTKFQKCKCESWCYCIRPSIQKEIDKIPFIDSKWAIEQKIKYWKYSSAGEYDHRIAQFIYMYGDE
jgi:hypothetical protein